MALPQWRPYIGIMESPCIKLCQIDQATRLCQGCFRSLDEIAGWSRMSDAERSAVMAVLDERRLVSAEA
ncbi:YbaK/prolyl-tRNA synthetase associated region [Roseibium sp. TrichSKD4]|nr:YbaK/prolyl-tRNA synthetase associated region [Roseibium sp. TrichSKD4]